MIPPDPADRRPVVELAPAHSWDCPECGREGFQRAVSVRLNPNNPDDAAMIRDIEGWDAGDPIPAWYAAGFTTRPDRVTCKHCGAEFRAVDSGADDPDEFADEDE